MHPRSQHDGDGDGDLVSQHVPRNEGIGRAESEGVVLTSHRRENSVHKTPTWRKEREKKKEKEKTLLGVAPKKRGQRKRQQKNQKKNPKRRKS